MGCLYPVWSSQSIRALGVVIKATSAFLEHTFGIRQPTCLPL